MLNDCRQQQQKVFKEALLEVSKGQGLHHRCQESDLEQTCSTAEGLGREGWGFTMSCSLNAATGAPGPSWHPEPPCTNCAQTISAHPAGPGCELGL